VFTVIKFLTTVLSTAGLHILEVLSPAHLLSELHAVREYLSLYDSTNPCRRRTRANEWLSRMMLQMNFP
jgi:hypothetical protein